MLIKQATMRLPWVAAWLPLAAATTVRDFDRRAAAGELVSDLVTELGARRGFCASTEPASAGNCTSGSKGSWPLMGPTPLASCLDRCRNECPRCRSISFSVSEAECSWYHDSCDALQPGDVHQTIAGVAWMRAMTLAAAVGSPTRRSASNPVCDGSGRCVSVVAFDTENSDMYPPKWGQAGAAVPFPVEFVRPRVPFRRKTSTEELLRRRVEAYRDYAEAAPKDRILFFVDARDVLWGGCPPESLGERFDSLNRTVVFGAELGCFPDGPYCARFPPVPPISQRRLVDCDWTCSKPPAYQYLNGGFIAARARHAVGLFRRFAIALADNLVYDQAVASDMFVQHGQQMNYGLDYGAVLSLQASRMKSRSFEVDSSGAIRSRLFDGTPLCFVHFNGGSKHLMSMPALRRPGVQRRARTSGMIAHHHTGNQGRAEGWLRSASTPVQPRAACARPGRHQKRILLDLGSNNGAWTAETLSRDSGAFDRVYVFEPNPRFNEELGLLVARYGVRHIRAAAWVHDGNISFHISKNDEASSLEADRASAWSRWKDCRPVQAWSNVSAYARRGSQWNGVIKRRAYSAAVCEKARIATVTSVDLSRFLRMRSCPQDHIKVKMDVEGAEFNVLHHMLKQGTACWINVLQLEWHLHGKQQRAEAEDLNVRLTQCGVRLAFNA